MTWQLLNRASYQRSQITKQAFELIAGDAMCQWVVVLGHQPLTNHDLLPGYFVEQFVALFKNLTRAFEQVYAVCERVRDIHIATVDPELTVCALVDLVVQDDEIADVLKFNLRLAIELVDFRLLDAVVWEVLDKSSQSGLYQMDAG